MYLKVILGCRVCLMGKAPAQNSPVRGLGWLSSPAHIQSWDGFLRPVKKQKLCRALVTGNGDIPEGKDRAV